MRTSMLQYTFRARRAKAASNGGGRRLSAVGSIVSTLQGKTKGKVEDPRLEPY